MTPEIQEKIVESINNYASNIEGKGVREILNTDYEPPDVTTDDFLKDPDVVKYVNFWKEAMKEWRQRYGSIEGWAEFDDYWALSGSPGVPDWAHGATAAEVFLGSQFQSIRDNFGFASPENLRELGPVQIGQGEGDLSG